VPQFVQFIGTFAFFNSPFVESGIKKGRKFSHGPAPFFATGHYAEGCY
jgi:hypothetical protein